MSMDEILFFHKINSAYASFCVETLRGDGSETNRHEGHENIKISQFV